MSTQCFILRTNRTMGRKYVKDKDDTFDFEGGTYFIEKEKVFIWKLNIRNKIRPTLLYIEGVSQALYLDNIKIKEYLEDVVITDKQNKIVFKEDGKTPKTEKKRVKHITDIFIDARSIHNMTDKKILTDLSAQPDIKASEIIIIILLVVSICLIVANFFIK
jgi:hypothetical protein